MVFRLCEMSIWHGQWKEEFHWSRWALLITSYTILVNYCFSYIDYYGVTFDHLVPADDPNPEVLAISIIEVDNDGGAFANNVLLFQIDPTEYTGKKVLAVPRCCQVKQGTQDRQRCNTEVAERNRETQRRS
jgi:hypothetical protein